MSQLAALLREKLSQPEAVEVCPIVAGDVIEYSCADGLKYDYSFGEASEPEVFGNGLFHLGV